MLDDTPVMIAACYLDAAQAAALTAVLTTLADHDD